MYKLSGKIQHYAWGGFEFIPQLLHIENNNDQPFAEYWLGTHPNGSAILEYDSNNQVNLSQHIKENPQKILGTKVANNFGNLPYLLKVLDVREMLSIQVHPTKTAAEEGFAKENEMGIPLDAAHRNYKDDNHKPEVMVALSEFWLLHGFKEEEPLLATLKKTAPLNFLLPVFEKEGYRGLYKHVMEKPQNEVDDLWNPYLRQLQQSFHQNQLSKTDPDYWACKALVNVSGQNKRIDRGIFSIYLFNIVHLSPGQAIFQGAGIPHAYLEGQNIELMSNSDNVLRGGLTPKHIDVPELLKHTLFKGVTPRIMNGEKRGTETIYRCPVPDFQVSKIEIDLNSDYQHSAYSAEILLLTEGEGDISSGQKVICLKKGESVFIPADESYQITTNSFATIYKAAVPSGH